MKGWNISQQTGARLVQKAEESIIWSEKTRHKQKMVYFNRVSNQIQHSDTISANKAGKKSRKRTNWASK